MIPLQDIARTIREVEAATVSIHLDDSEQYLLMVTSYGETAPAGTASSIMQ